MTGFESPNYTMIPNDLFDVEMSKMGYAELKVILAICRQTFGYHKMERNISLSTLTEMTGLSRISVLQGAKEAEKHGYIQKQTTGRVNLWMVKLLNQSENGLVKLLNRNSKATLPPSIKESIKETQNEIYQEQFFELKIKEQKPQKQQTSIEKNWDSIKQQLIMELPNQWKTIELLNAAIPLQIDDGRLIIATKKSDEFNCRFGLAASRLAQGITNDEVKEVYFREAQ